MSRVLGLLGLGLRAGNLVVGVDGTRAALQAGRCRCVVVARDAGPRAREKVLRLAEGRGIPSVVGPSQAELGARLGRPPVAAVAVLDAALARGVLQALDGPKAVTEE